MKPKVSIICITYNQEKFIAQALDSFLIQKTDFPFEVIVHDDASTDKTKDIIFRYKELYPDIIKPVFEKTNQFSKGKLEFIDNMFRSAKGKYIALCEGDDYWTDPDKLQKQSDFLDNNSSYSMCFHPVEVIFEDNTSKKYIYPNTTDINNFKFENLLGGNFIQTASVMYRRANYQKLHSDTVPNDWYLHLYHAQFGKIGFINKVMGVYRRHSRGAWWDNHNNASSFWKNNWQSQLSFYSKILHLFGKNNNTHEKIIEASIINSLSIISEIDKKNNYNLLEKVVDKFPEFIPFTIRNLHTQIVSIHQQLIKLEEDNVRLNNELEDIYSSKGWKYLQNARKAKYKIIKPHKNH